MANEYSKKYFGTATWTTSTGGEDLVGAHRTAKGLTHLDTKEFDFFNQTECVVQINGSDSILLAAEEGFNDVGIYKFSIITAGVVYKCQASY